VRPKPSGLDRQYSEQFCDAAVVAAYGARPPYPERVVALLVGLATDDRARVLDLGCGTGELARRLAAHVQHVTAVDHSSPMLAQARALPGGEAPNLTWIAGRVEDVPLEGPFSCAFAAESFHWFDWDTVVTRLRDLVPSGRLILVERRERSSPWMAHLDELIAVASTNREFQAFELVDELIARGCLRVEGRATLPRQPFKQSIADYVRSLHSRNGLSLDRLSRPVAEAFDAHVTAIVAPHAIAGLLTLWIETRVVWGTVRVS
jgi:SAM-dependent methyltransferase